MWISKHIYYIAFLAWFLNNALSSIAIWAFINQAVVISENCLLPQYELSQHHMLKAFFGFGLLPFQFSHQIQTREIHLLVPLRNRRSMVRWLNRKLYLGAHVYVRASSSKRESGPISAVVEVLDGVEFGFRFDQHFSEHKLLLQTIHGHRFRGKFKTQSILDALKSVSVMQSQGSPYGTGLLGGARPKRQDGTSRQERNREYQQRHREKKKRPACDINDIRKRLEREFEPTVPEPIEVERSKEAERKIGQFLRVESIRYICLCCGQLEAMYKCTIYRYSSAKDEEKSTGAANKYSEVPEAFLERLLLVTKTPQRKLEYLGDKWVPFQELNPEAQSPLNSKVFKTNLPDLVVKEYDVTEMLGEQFADCLLCPEAVTTDKLSQEILLVFCESCHDSIVKGNRKKFDELLPPKFAIANGNWIGRPVTGINDVEKAALSRYNVFQRVVVHWPNTSNSKLYHGSVQVFAVNHSVASTVLPNLHPDCTGSFRVIWSGPGVPSAKYLKGFAVRVDVIKVWQSFLRENNPNYKDSDLSFMSEDAIERVLKKADGAVVFLDKNYQGSPEVTTHIGPSSDECVVQDGNNDSNDDFDFVSMVGNIQFEPVTSSTEGRELHHCAEAKNPMTPEQAEHHRAFLVQSLESVTVHGHASRVYISMPGVLEGALWWLFKFGIGGMHEERFVPLSKEEWFQRLFRLADRTYAKDALLISFAIETYSFWSAFKSSYMLSGKLLSDLSTVSQEDISCAIQQSLRDDANLRERVQGDRSTDVLRAHSVVSSGVLGTKESRMRDRRNLFGLITKFGLPHLFITFNPSHRQSIVAYRHITGEAPQEWSSELPAAMLKEITADVEGQVYSFMACVDAFIRYVLGWDPGNREPIPSEGCVGNVAAYFTSIETTAQSFLHSHWLVWLEDAPRGPHEWGRLKQKLHEGKAHTLVDLLEEYFTSIAQSHFDNNIVSTLIDKIKCDVCGASLNYTGVPKRFRLKKRIANDVPTCAECMECKKGFTGREVIEKQIQEFMQKLNVFETSFLSLDKKTLEFAVKYGLSEALNSSQWKQPPNPVLTIPNRDALFVEFHRLLEALFLCDFQMHRENHCATCFKKADPRNPENCTCRSSFPRLYSTESLLERIFELKVPMFHEYFNVGLKGVGLAFLCNTDIKLLATDKDVGALIVYYIVKYVAKPQDLFARKDIDAIVRTMLTRFFPRAGDHGAPNVSAGGQEIREDSDAASKSQDWKSDSRKLALKLFNLLSQARSQNIDFSMGLFHLYTNKQTYSSHTFNSLSYGHLVNRYFDKQSADEQGKLFEPDDDDTIDKSQANPQPRRPESYREKDLYLTYRYRPLVLEEVSFHRFVSLGCLKKNPKGYTPKEQELFKEGFGFRDSHHFAYFADSDAHVTTLIGPNFPAKLSRGRNPLKTLGRRDGSLFEEDTNIEDYEEDDTYSRPLDENKDELFGFLVYLLFYPHRHEIGQDHSPSDSWYATFEQIVPELQESDRLALMALLESRAPKGAQKKYAEEKEEWQLEALKDFNEHLEKITNSGHENQANVLPCAFSLQPDMDDDIIQRFESDESAEIVEMLKIQGKKKKAQAIINYYDGLFDSANPPSTSNSQSHVTSGPPSDASSVTTVDYNLDEALGKHKRFLADVTASATHMDLSPPSSLANRTTTTTSSVKIERIVYDTRAPEIFVLHIAERHGLAGLQKETFELLASKLLRAANKDSTYTPSANFRANERLEIIIGGAGGTGKSYIIAAVDSLACELGISDVVVKTSEFGSTASNVQGYTTKSLVHAKRSAQGRFNESIKQCLLLIIDEYGLSNLKNLHDLDTTFQSVKQIKEPFGGCHVALFGDHYQLPPVKSSSFHGEKAPLYSNIIAIRDWFHSIQNVRVLTNQRRFADQPMLLSISSAYRSGGRYTSDHVKFCNDRRISVNDIDLQSSIMMVATKAEKAHIYELHATAMLDGSSASPHAVCCWSARFTRADLTSKQKHADEDEEDGKTVTQRPKKKARAKKVDSTPITLDSWADEPLHQVYRSINESVVMDDDSDHILAFSAFRVGQLVNITKNQSVEAGLANGTFARIRWFEFPSGTCSQKKHVYAFGRKVTGTVYSSPPTTVWVELVKPSIHIPGLGDRLRPIGLYKATAGFKWADGRDASFAFENVPLLPACAMTVHSMQGKTVPEELQVIAFDKSPFFKGLGHPAWYVMMTRVKKADQLKILASEALRLSDLKRHVPPVDDMRESQRIGRLNELTSIRLSSTAPRNPDYDMHEANKLLGQNFGFDTPSGLCWLAAAIQLIYTSSSVLVSSGSLSKKKKTMIERLERLHTHLTNVCNLLKTSERPLESSYLSNIQQDAGSGSGENGAYDIGEFFFQNSSIFAVPCIQISQVPESNFEPGDYQSQLLNNRGSSTAVLFCFRRGLSSGRKNRHLFFFPESFQLQNVTYELSCLIEHEGETCRGGHWIPWVKLNPSVQSATHFYAKVDGSAWGRPVKHLPHQDKFFRDGNKEVLNEERDECEGLVNREATLLFYTCKS